MLLLQSTTGSELQRCVAAAEKLLLSSHISVLCTVHVNESVDHNDWQLMSATSRDLHGMGIMGIPRGWKLILWGSRRDGKTVRDSHGNTAVFEFVVCSIITYMLCLSLIHI